MKKVGIRWLSLVLCFVMAFVMTACSVNEDTMLEMPEETTTEFVKVTKTDDSEIIGIYVDDSYRDSDGSPLKMVYLFLKLSAKSKNMQCDSRYTKMTIGPNTYESEFYKGACDYMPNYYYSSFIEDVYVGSTFMIALTFKVPQGDLQGNKTITFSDSDMPINDLKLTTDDIVKCTSVKEIGAEADPSGYAKIENKRKPADAATERKVSNALNGYYWTFYVTLGTSLQQYELEFMEPNKFEIRTSLGSNGGTYKVMNGYVFITYSSNGKTVEIPYEFVGGQLNLYCAEAFSIYE